MFERICRRNGITAILTKPRSPTTTGKVERFHQTLQADCLTAHGPFPSVEAAQGAVDAFVTDYNHHRPHQALDDDVPASRFVPRPATDGAALGSGLGVDIPAELLRRPSSPALEHGCNAALVAAGAAGADELMPPAAVPVAERGPGFLTESEHWLGGEAIEVGRVVPASGNIAVGGQQFWIGPANAGQLVRLWMDTTTVHVSLTGRHLRTVPSRQSPVTLARLRADGARPAGPPPNRAVPLRGLPPGTAVEIDRVVAAAGTIGLAGRAVVVGQPLAGQRITLRLVDQVAHVIADGVLVRTIASPVPPEHRGRLWGARLVDDQAPAPQLRPVQVQRRVSSEGTARVAGQVLRLGRTHAKTIVEITVHDRHLHVHALTGQALAVIPRTTTKEIIQFKAAGWRDRIQDQPLQPERAQLPSTPTTTG